MGDGRVSHAYLFEGPSFIDKKEFADAFIKGVLCPKKMGTDCGECGICAKINHGNHEDVFYVTADGASTKDKSVEEAQDRLNVKPLGDRNVVVIEDADSMTLRAQNRLLKTLEEPPGNSLLILLSSNVQNLVSTILSRCVVFRINGTQDTSDEDTGSMAKTIVEMSLSGKTFTEMKNRINPLLKDRDKCMVLLDAMQAVYRDMALGRSDVSKSESKGGSLSLYKFDDIYENVKHVEEARTMIREGVNVGYAMKNLLLNIGGK